MFLHFGAHLGTTMFWSPLDLILGTFRHPLPLFWAELCCEEEPRNFSVGKGRERAPPTFEDGDVYGGLDFGHGIFGIATHPGGSLGQDGHGLLRGPAAPDTRQAPPGQRLLGLGPGIPGGKQEQQEQQGHHHPREQLERTGNTKH